MTARAAPPNSPGRPAASRRLLGPLIAIAGVFAAEPAAAQLAVTAALDTDLRARGYSLSNGNPAASLRLAYDHPAGVYAGISAVAEASHHPRLLGAIANAGYAKRVNDHITIDVGVLRSQLRSAYRSASSFEYTEVYVGGYAGPFVGHIYYSPDYRSPSQSTLYSEVETGFEPAKDWAVSGHVGLLDYLNSSLFYEAGERHYDWRLSITRRLGSFEIHSAVSGGGPHTYYGHGFHDYPALTAGGSVSF